MPEAIGRATGWTHSGGLGEGVGVATGDRKGEGVRRAATVELLHATAQTSNSTGHAPTFS
jgi:hypothetical protein